MTDDIVLPFNWEPREPQMRLWTALESGVKRAMMVAHRRWGKDEVGLHYTCTAMHTRVGTYWHCLPEYAQAKKAIWDAVNPHTGRRRIDEAFPKELRESTRADDMFIRMKNGSTWQVIGSDRFRGLVGAGVCGIVFSEWAKANPAAWAYLAPMLVENNGWALFITTPQGRNHAKRLYDMAKNDPHNWYAELQSVVDSGLISLEDVEKQRAEYRALYGNEGGDSLIQQEFYCDFDAPVLGSFWGRPIADAEKIGRVQEVDVIPELPVHTMWGLGEDDAVGIWCFQLLPDRINLVDYTESHTGDIEGFAAWLKERKYNGLDYLPPSARMRDYSPSPTRTRLETMRQLGRKPILVPDVKLVDRIHAGRITLKSCYFDKMRTERGLDCLKAFSAEWDEESNVPKQTPKHNWASYAAFSFGHLAVTWQLPRTSERDKIKVELERLHRHGVNVTPLRVSDLGKKRHNSASKRRGY
jgi:phage terminase large subunit